MIDDGWQHWNTEFSNYDLDIHGQNGWMLSAGMFILR